MPLDIPSVLLAVDPGTRGCGVALFLHGELVRAEYVPCIGSRDPLPSDDTLVNATECALRATQWASIWATTNHAENTISIGSTQVFVRQCVALIEDMRVYAGSKGRADPQDLLNLQSVGAALAGLFVAKGWRVESVPARKWNGQLPRNIRMERTKDWLWRTGRLDRVYVPEREPALVHNAWSAVGIGRWRVDPVAR